MAPPDPSFHLRRMLDNIERIRRWTDGLTLEAYRANPMLRDAVERCLERISEASRHLPMEAKDSQLQIPWRKIGDIGNALRHEYDDVADTEVWRIVEDDLRALKDAVQAMIGAP